MNMRGKIARAILKSNGDFGEALGFTWQDYLPDADTGRGYLIREGMDMESYLHMSYLNQISVRSGQPPFIAYLQDKIMCGFDGERAENVALSQVKLIAKTKGISEHHAWLSIDADYIDWLTCGQTIDDNDPMIRVMMYLIEMANSHRKDDAVKYMFEMMVSVFAALQGPAFKYDEEHLTDLIDEAVKLSNSHVILGSSEKCSEFYSN